VGQEHGRSTAIDVCSNLRGVRASTFACAGGSGGRYLDRGDLFWRIVGGGGVSVDRAGARRLAQPAASEKAEAVEELSGETKAALLDCIGRAASAVPAHLQSRPDEQFQVDFTDSHLDNPAATFWLLIETGDANPIVVEVRMDGRCVLSLQSMKTTPVAGMPSPAELAASKMGMLMDVELVVKVRFGGRRMLLKDILDLCAGSVVELDQEVQEPVDLLLDGKLIARGEVVVVDGNYGLRITEVLSSAGN
jgi:flagellar motor switch protein FliN